MQREKRTRNNLLPKFAGTSITKASTASYSYKLEREKRGRENESKLRTKKRTKPNMERQEGHQQGKGGQVQEKKPNLEGLPLKDSPYLQYKDLEDYKLRGYGAQGHLEPKPGRGPGSTDAPTMPGSAVSTEAELAPAEAAHRQGVFK